MTMMTAWVRTPVILSEGRACVGHLQGWRLGDLSRHWEFDHSHVKKHFFQTSREEFPVMSSPAMDDTDGA